jgi:hypothetical protein
MASGGSWRYGSERTAAGNFDGSESGCCAGRGREMDLDEWMD